MYKMLPRVLNRSVSPVLAETAPLTFFRPLSTEVRGMNGTEDVSNAKPFEEIPGFRSFPLIGTAWIYFPIIGKYDIHRQHHADLDQYRKFGDIVREKFGHFHLISLFNPKDVETVLRNEGNYPNKSGIFDSIKAYRELRKEWYKTPGIIILQGKEWYDLRSKVQPRLMKPKLIHAFLGAMEDISHELIERIRFLRDSNNEIPDIAPELYKWALETIGYVSLDTRLGCLSNNLDANHESSKMIKAVETMFHCITKLESFTGNILWWKFLPSPTWNKFVKASDYFTQVALRYINRAFEELEKNDNEERDLTLLQTMLRTPGLDISGVMTTVMDLLFAGIDTTSHAECFLLYHLATNPEKQEKLYDEIMKVLPSPKDNINATTLNELRYMKACMRESMRLLPIARGVLRQLDHDLVLSGFRVPAGVYVYCLNQTPNRLEKNYPNANEFIPERWLDRENKSNPYLSQPFGIGIRSCIGRRLAEQEMMCATTPIIKNFRVEYHGEDVDILTGVIGAADKPLKFKFIDRA